MAMAMREYSATFGRASLQAPRTVRPAAISSSSSTATTSMSSQCTMQMPGAPPRELLTRARLGGVEEVLEGGDAERPHRGQLRVVALGRHDGVKEVVHARPPVALADGGLDVRH